MPPRPGDRGAASCPAARPWARRRPDLSNRVQAPVRSTHSHYPGSTPAHSCLNVWERLRQAGPEPGGRARGWGPGYCARKTWFCSSLDLLTPCHRPITERVHRSPPTPAVSRGFSVLLGKKTKDHLWCSSSLRGKLLLQGKPEESPRETAPLSTKPTWRDIPKPKELHSPHPHTPSVSSTYCEPDIWRDSPEGEGEY